MLLNIPINLFLNILLRHFVKKKYIYFNPLQCTIFQPSASCISASLTPFWFLHRHRWHKITGMAAQMISILRVPAYSAKFMPKIRRAVSRRSCRAKRTNNRIARFHPPPRRLDRAGDPICRRSYDVWSIRVGFKGCVWEESVSQIPAPIYSKAYGRTTLHYSDN